MPLHRREIGSVRSLQDNEIINIAENNIEFNSNRSQRVNQDEVLSHAAMAGYTGLLEQLGLLAKYSEEIFQDLLQMSKETSSRLAHAGSRVCQLTERVPELENVFRNARIVPYSYYTNQGVEYKSDTQGSLMQNQFGPESMPQGLRERYHQCEQTPALHLLDPYESDEDKRPCVKQYTNPHFFVEEWLHEVNEEREEREKRKQERRKARKQQNEKLLLRKASIGNISIPKSKTLSAKGAEFDSSEPSATPDQIERHVKKSPLVPRLQEQPKARPPMPTLSLPGNVDRAALGTPRVNLGGDDESGVVHSSSSPKHLQDYGQHHRQPMPPSRPMASSSTSSSSRHPIFGAPPPSPGLAARGGSSSPTPSVSIPSPPPPPAAGGAPPPPPPPPPPKSTEKILPHPPKKHPTVEVTPSGGIKGAGASAPPAGPPPGAGGDMAGLMAAIRAKGGGGLKKVDKASIEPKGPGGSVVAKGPSGGPNAAAGNQPPANRGILDAHTGLMDMIKGGTFALKPVSERKIEKPPPVKAGGPVNVAEIMQQAMLGRRGAIEVDDDEDDDDDDWD